MELNSPIVVVVTVAVDNMGPGHLSPVSVGMHYVHSFAHCPVHAAGSLVELDAGRNRVVTVSRYSFRIRSASFVEIAGLLGLGNMQES